MNFLRYFTSGAEVPLQGGAIDLISVIYFRSHPSGWFSNMCYYGFCFYRILHDTMSSCLHVDYLDYYRNKC